MSSDITEATLDKQRKTSRSQKGKLRRPRGKRGGVKNKGAIAKRKPHAKHIGQFHTLEKQLAQTTDPVERKKLLQEQKRLGGIQAYQDASLFGSDKLRGGETGKWCAERLLKIVEKKSKIRLLDVGSLQGTAYDKYSWIETTCIDINPRSERVLRYDFFDYPIPKPGEASYNVVALSLVINFVGDIAARGHMLLHAHKYIQDVSSTAGFLFLVLPRACVENSRYCTHNHLREILTSCGWGDIVYQDDSSRLTRWLCRETSKEWDGTVFKKQELRKGVKLNNFCIVVK